jgi:hypothetical protein
MSEKPKGCPWWNAIGKHCTVPTLADAEFAKCPYWKTREAGTECPGDVNRGKEEKGK